jgi:hypothetical protein
MTPLIKKTLLVSLLIPGILVAVVFAFGSADPLTYAIPAKPPAIRLESLPQATAALSKTNITTEVAKQIAEEITDKNAEGLKSGAPAGLETIDPDIITQEVLEKAFKEVRIEDLRPAIALSDLIIIKSNDQAFARQYFANLNTIIAKNFPPGLSVNWEDPAATNFGALINAYAVTMSESLAVPVPSELAELHRTYISLLGAERNTLTLIKNYLIDPAQAAVAIEAGDTFTAELVELFRQMDAYIIEHKLNA